MNWKKILLAINLFFAFSSTLSAHLLNADGDFQLWLHEEVDQPFTKKCHFYFETEQRFGGDGSTLFHYFLQGNIRYLLRDWLELAPGYRQSFNLDPEIKRWFRVYEPMFFAILHRKKGKWEFRIRHQVEYRIFENGPALWLYRIRPWIYLPLELGKKIKAQPYIFDELFFMERRGFAENRLGGGLRFRFTKSFSSQFQYFRSSLWTGHEWIHRNVIRLYGVLEF